MPRTWTAGNDQVLHRNRELSSFATTALVNEGNTLFQLHGLDTSEWHVEWECLDLTVLLSHWASDLLPNPLRNFTETVHQPMSVSSTVGTLFNRYDFRFAIIYSSSASQSWCDAWALLKISNKDKKVCGENTYCKVGFQRGRDECYPSPMRPLSIQLKQEKF